MGDPNSRDTIQRPIIDEKRMMMIIKYIESGKVEGALPETGGKRVGQNGAFIAPTVFSNVTDDMRIARVVFIYLLI